MDKKILILGGTSVLSLAVGAVGGYYYAKKKLWDEFSERLEQEVEDTKKFYSALHKKGDFRTPEEAVRKLIPEHLSGDTFNSGSVTNETLERVLVGLKYMPEKEDDRPGPPERHLTAIRGEDPRPPIETNIFEEVRVHQDLPEDFNEEIARASGKPYVIPFDVFMHAEVGYPQLTFTFFEGDRVVVDDRDALVGVANEVGGYIDDVFGMDNFRFGYLSGDNNVVYIRNDKTGYDYEVLKSEGKYSEEIAGFTENEEPEEAQRT